MTNATQHATRAPRDAAGNIIIVTSRMRVAGASAIEDGIGIMSREEMAEAAYIAMVLENKKILPRRQRKMEIARSLERY
jgi:hypothetical protein